jgi:hypothetical protein
VPLIPHKRHAASFCRAITLSLLQLLLNRQHKNPAPLPSPTLIRNRNPPLRMPGIGNINLDLPLPTIINGLRLPQISEDIRPTLPIHKQITEPLPGRKPDPPPLTREFMRPVAIVNVRGNFLPPPPPPRDSGNNQRSNDNGDANSHTQSKLRRQRIKRPNSAINQRDQRKQSNDYRHRAVPIESNQNAVNTATASNLL